MAVAEMKSDVSIWEGKMIPKSIFALGLFIASTGAFAKESSAGTSELAKVAVNQAKLTTASGRLALAKAVNIYCNDIKSVYPRNSPSEEQWLDGEISGGGNRVEKALSSAELGRRMAKRFTDDCETSSQWAVKQPDKGIHFVILAHDFIRFSGDAAFYAKLNGIDSERFWLENMPRMAAEALTYAAIMIETTKESN